MEALCAGTLKSPSAARSYKICFFLLVYFPLFITLCYLLNLAYDVKILTIDICSELGLFMTKKILVVDDIEINRTLLSEILRDTYQILEASDGEQAIAVLKSKTEEIALVLLDLIMPRVDGYAVMRYMKESDVYSRIPVVVISADGNAETERKCLKLGASDFIRKPFDNITVKNRVKNLADLFVYKNQLEDLVYIQTEGLNQQNKILEQQTEYIKAVNEKITEVLGTIVEYRHFESGNHIKRVKGFTKILAENMAERYPEYGLNQKRISVISDASALHDIGKIAIKDSILLKPGKLSLDEFDQIKEHTIKGYEMLCRFTETWDEEYADASKKICRWHHERYDGKGYPDGLKGEEIPVEAQIVSIADVYDALTTKRIYKDAFEMDKAFDMVVNGECGVFSPKILNCFQNKKTEFEHLAKRFKEADVETYGRF